jgi:hypothetical protein
MPVDSSLKKKGFPPGRHDYTPNRLRWSFFYPFHHERLWRPRKKASSVSSGNRKPRKCLSYRQLLVLRDRAVLGFSKMIGKRPGFVDGVRGLARDDSGVYGAAVRNSPQRSLDSENDFINSVYSLGCRRKRLYQPPTIAESKSPIQRILDEIRFLHTKSSVMTASSWFTTC